VLVSVDNEEFDNEGRIVLTRFDNFTLLNVYFPNGQVGKGDKRSDSEDAKKRLSRLDYKLRFYDYFFDYIEELKNKGESLVICGDYNTAHKEIDLARPKHNVENTGFLPEERAWMDKLVEAGYVDTFRKFHHNEEDWYTWWTYRGGARQRNVGWRIDYFFVSADLEPALKSAFIMTDVMGSDHCPLGIELEL
jgi:exodeoxyribonuclease-3